MPALLADATWYGTLAAARDLGAHGVPVTLASDTRVAPARWSRFVATSVACPSTKRAPEFVEWLLRFGRTRPRHVLCATSDDSAWLIAQRAEELSRSFELYSSPIGTVECLLDKVRLAEAARAAGLQVPEMHAPQDVPDLIRCGRALGFPLYMKPRLQVLGSGLGKGVRIEEESELVATWRALQRTARFDPLVLERVPQAALPVLQASVDRPERIYTVDGFVDESGELYASLACVMLLQRPRGSGSGIVFAEAEVDPAIDDGLRRLFRATGFRGVFDAEFLERSGERLLIDMNPRFYNHMAFEVERGLHLPWLAYLAARGEREALRAEVRAANEARVGRLAYVHRMPTALMLWAQSLTGAMPAAERGNLRALLTPEGGRSIDPARHANDPGPAFCELALEVRSALRHPRAYLRQLISPGPRARTWRRASQGRRPSAGAFAAPDGGSG